MSAALAGLFSTAVELTGTQHLLLMLPLCLSVAVVYKTTRCDNLREVPLAAVVLWITIVIGMCAVGVALWVLFEIMV
jgi:hypothetical protein